MQTFKFKQLLTVMSVLLLSFTVISCDNNDDEDITGRNYTISGNSSGSQVVPAVAGAGTGTMSGSYNDMSNVLTYNSSWNGLTGAPMTAGFYNGAAGSMGTSMGSGWTIPGGATGTGSLNGSMTLTDAQEAQMLGGQWYYSYGTTTNTGGEIRGQMTATP